MRVTAIGECMLELAPERAGGVGAAAPTEVGLGYGGDTLNTAIYLARLGIEVEYLTALGDDPYSDWMLAQWHLHRVATSHVRRLPNRLPGVYAIHLDASGERRFYYWRQQSAAKSLFVDVDVDAIVGWLVDAELIYTSGISLAIYDEISRAKLLDALGELRRQGKKVAFDPNYRPALWKSAAAAKKVYSRFLSQVDIVLPTFEDEQTLYRDKTPSHTLDRFDKGGVDEIVVKDGAGGCMVKCQGERHLVPVPEAITPIDTTAAGDSFNAGYLAARLSQTPPFEAALAGHRLAAKVIQRRGAIVTTC